VKRTISVVVVLLVTGLQVGAARADLVSYSFTAMDSQTGTPVLGSFAYQTNAVASPLSSEASYFLTSGSMTMTYNGYTYSTTSITAILQPDSLQLSSSNNASGQFLGITLASSGSSTIFSNLSSLPTTLNLSVLNGSTFSIGQEVPPAPPGFASLPLGWQIAAGPISALGSAQEASVSGAPEPGGLLLAALGATVLISRTVRRRERR
jgi:hypothetical protein